jgi:hypothetical protein
LLTGVVVVLVAAVSPANNNNNENDLLPPPRVLGSRFHCGVGLSSRVTVV